MQPCDTVVNSPLTLVRKIFNISTSEFRTATMHRRIRACTYEFLANVTEGVVHDVYKVMSRICRI